MTMKTAAQTQPTNTKPATPQHPLTGAGLHWKDVDDCVNRQASILKVIPSGNPSVGDLALIQYYEWMGGSPSTQQLIPLTELASPNWVFYADTEEMNDHYTRVDEHRNQHIRGEKATAAKSPDLAAGLREIFAPLAVSKLTR